jgi:predicted DNA-binding protein with PD1-like motif
LQGKDNGDGFIVLKLDDGDDLSENLRIAIKHYHITSGFIVMGIGMLKNIEIGYFTGSGYKQKRLEKPHELISLQGSISTKGEVIIHLHCSLANDKHEVVGGHLTGATVCVLNEILIKKTENIVLKRNLNPFTGLRELYISYADKFQSLSPTK